MGPNGEELQKKADLEIDRILDEQYKRAFKMLSENRDVLDKIAVTLLEKEKITGSELLKVVDSVNPDLISKETTKKVEEQNVILPSPSLQPAFAAMSKSNL